MANPAARDAGGGLCEQGDAGGAGPRGVGGAELAAEVAEAGGRQQRVAGGVRGDVAVGVTLEAVVLVGPGQPGEVHRHAGREAVHVDADAHAGQARRRRHRAVRRRRSTAAIMPERQSTGEDIPARLVARGRGGRHGRARDQLLRGDGDDDPRVAGRRRRRAGHPAHPGRRSSSARSSVLGHHDKTFLVVVLLVVLGLLFAWAGRLARRSWWKPLTVFAAIAGAGPAWPSRSSTSAQAHRRAAGPRGLRDLGGLPVACSPTRCAATSASRPSGRGRPPATGDPVEPRRPPGAASSSAPGLMAAGLGRRRRPRPGRSARAAARWRRRGGCCGCPGSAEPDAARRRLGRPRGRRAVADAERRRST